MRTIGRYTVLDKRPRYAILWPFIIMVPFSRITERGLVPALVESVRTGMPYELAANKIGLSPATLRTWMKRGKEANRDVNGDVIDLTDKPYADLFYKLTTARHERLQEALDIIRAQAKPHTTTTTTTTKKQTPVCDRYGNPMVRYDPDYCDPVTGKPIPIPVYTYEESVQVKEGTEVDVKAAMWYAERSHRQSFGRSIRDPKPIGDVSKEDLLNLAKQQVELMRSVHTNLPTDPLAEPEDIEDGDGEDNEDGV